MDDFSKALKIWMNRDDLSCKALGEMLKPKVSVSGVHSWQIGRSEPKRHHRRQLIKLSKGTITHDHFI